jgi:histidyl-tRNA synthetase
MTFRPPKGTDDLLAPESQAWRDALAAWDDWSARYGYPLVATPIMESTELFERGVGTSTEVVTKQMYTFTDRGGRSLTLRPEGTAGVVRAYLNAGGQGPWKGAYSGPFFRHEQPQGGRRRQFWQVGVEYLDVESPVADAEVIELGFRYLGAVGVPSVRLLINSLGDAKCRPAFLEALRDHLEARRSELGEDARRLIDVNPLRVLDSKTDADALADAPSMASFLCDDCATHHEGVKGLLDGLEVPYTEEGSLVRGLDYYTRTAFEYIGTGLATAQNAVGGGGRYDGLAESLGGHKVPGVGFALGMDRIILSSGSTRRAHIDAYLVSELPPAETIGVASAIRGQGVRLDFDGEGRSVKAQFRAARRLEAPVILVYKGPGLPIDAQTESGRDEVPMEAVAEWLRARR